MVFALYSICDSVPLKAQVEGPTLPERALPRLGPERPQDLQLPPLRRLPPASPDLLKTQPEPAPEPESEPEPAQPGPSEAPESSEGESKIEVKQFRFEGNTVFSDAELAALIQSFLNKPLTFTQLLEARTVISNYYIDKGYTTSGAFIPVQESKDGIITIRVLEGKLGSITVDMKGKLRPWYVKSRLAIAGRAPLNVPRLLEGLQKLQTSPLIKTISAELAASPEPGVSDLIVKGVTAQTFTADVVVDNGRNPQVGSIQRGPDLYELNLFGIGDAFTASYRQTDGSKDLQLSYEVPVNAYNGTLRFSYRTLTSTVIEQPLAELDIDSDFQQYFVSFRQPLVQTLNKEFALGINVDKQDSRSLIGGRPFPGRGVNRFGQANVTTIGFFQDWLNRSEQHVFGVRSEFNFGINALGATNPINLGIDEEAPDNNYFFWGGQVQYIRSLGPDALFIARTDIQLADAPLPSIQQFGLGGLGSVEGYRQNTLLTDSGFLAAMEVRLPILRFPKSKVLLQIVPLTALGHGWNMGASPQPEINTLASVGMGLQLQINTNVSARISYARRLGRIPYFSGNTLQDDGILFTFSLSP